jgi:oxalate decarboxylase/phosphoglucose isomerase-like protein (cupin superfamily)
MHFVRAVVTSVLALATLASAAPTLTVREDAGCEGESASSSTTSAAAGATGTADDDTPVTLSKTQQVFLADLASERYKLLSDEDFVFDFNKAQENPGAGGELIAANRKTMPALVGTGASMTLGRISACGINTFHTHPRSAELQLVISGKLITHMTPENGVTDNDGKRRVISATVLPNQMTVFPMGSVHTQFNDACEPASFIAAFASEDAGTGQIADQAFAFDSDLIGAVLGGEIAAEDIDAVRAAIPKSVAQGVDECIERCGITKRSYY